MEGQGVGEHAQWSIHMDGSSNRQAGGAGIVLRSPEKGEFQTKFVQIPKEENK